MGFFDGFRGRKPIQEQLERLSRITNPHQKKALLATIEAGEQIPEYAWSPLPQDLDIRRLASDARSRMAQWLAEEIRRCAEMARLTATKASGYLCTPIANCDALGSAAAFTPLCAWGIFNPFGPTMKALMLVDAPHCSARLLFCRQLHPLAPSAVVYGLIPEAPSKNAEQLALILRRLFERNGSPEHPLLGSLPTHIPAVRDSPISKGWLKELFFLSAQHVDMRDIDATCHRMVTCKGDPWKRVAAELKAGPQAALDSSTGELQPAPATRAQLERWWALVTDPEHVQSETSQMQKAWEGATQFSQGRPQ